MLYFKRFFATKIIQNHELNLMKCVPKLGFKRFFGVPLKIFMSKNYKNFIKRRQLHISDTRTHGTLFLFMDTISSITRVNARPCNRFSPVAHTNNNAQRGAAADTQATHIQVPAQKNERATSHQAVPSFEKNKKRGHQKADEKKFFYSL